MQLTISIACYNKVDVTRQCIESLTQTNLDDVEFIFTDNGSSDDTVDLIRDCSLQNVRIIRYGVNRGFGEAHNEALKIARGEYFCVMNNDIFIQDHDWVNKMLAPFGGNPKVMIVGFEGTPCTIGPAANGFLGPRKEYVDGGCIVIPTAAARKYGLFSPIYRMCYYEDSDLSLRLRQMGFALRYVQISHVHHRGSTASTVMDESLKRIIEGNRVAFTKKWDRYLQSRSFTNAILVRMYSIGIGDVVAMTPVLEALRKEHPTAEIVLNTPFPEVFENNPHVNSIGPMDQKHGRGFDRVVDITLQGQDPVRTLAEEAAVKAGVKLKDHASQLFLTQGEVEEARDVLNELKGDHEGPTVILNLFTSRTTWHGRTWRMDNAKALISGLNDLGFFTVEVGKGIATTELAAVSLIDKTSLRGLFAVIACADMFVGIDSLAFHVAQALKIPSYILFGATEPVSRINDFTTTVAIRKENLSCIGCYGKPGSQPINKCRLGSEECMSGIAAEDVLSLIRGDVDPMVKNVEYLQRVIRS